MKVLVIDTALGLCSAGVFRRDGGRLETLGLRSESMDRGHQEKLGGFVRDVVADAGGFDGIDRVGVTVGPGSFTGLRVGLAFAQGLGEALGLPVVGVSTLDALAVGTGEAVPTAALIDARRGQVYARFWIDGVPRGEPEALSVEAASSRTAALAADGEDVILVGSGASLVAAPPGARVLTPAGPSPEAVAWMTLLSDPAHAPARPIYLRAPDATPPTRLPGQARAPRPAVP